MPTRKETAAASRRVSRVRADSNEGRLEANEADLVRLRVRIIALENLLIALLSDTSDRQVGLVREMAAFISPRAGFTQHFLTVNAAAKMQDLVSRALTYRGAVRAGQNALGRIPH